MTGPLHGLQHGGPLHEAPHGHTSKFIHVIIGGVGSILTYSLCAVKVVTQKNLGPSVGRNGMATRWPVSLRPTLAKAVGADLARESTQSWTNGRSIIHYTYNRAGTSGSSLRKCAFYCVEAGCKSQIKRSLFRLIVFFYDYFLTIGESVDTFFPLRHFCNGAERTSGGPQRRTPTTNERICIYDFSDLEDSAVEVGPRPRRKRKSRSPQIPPSSPSSSPGRRTARRPNSALRRITTPGACGPSLANTAPPRTRREGVYVTRE